MIEQLCFNSLLYIIGYIFLLVGFHTSVHLRHIMSLFMGMALWATISTFLIIFSIPLNLATILSAYIISIAIIALVKRKDLIKLKKIRKKNIIWFLIYFSIFIIVNIIVFYFNFIYVSGDSLMYMGIGLDIGRSGYFPPPEFLSGSIQSLEYFLQGRMIFLASLSAGSYFFNIDFFSTIFPLSAVYFIPTFIILFLIASESLKLKKKTRFLLATSGALMSTMLPAYWSHAYYVNNNLFVSIYFTICILCVFIYRHQRKRLWLVLGAISLVSTVLQRTEMSIFSLIPIAMLMSTKKLDRKDFRLFLSIFISISFSWHLFKIYYLGLGRHYHDWGLIHLLIFSSCILLYFIVHFDKTRKIIASQAPEILLSILMIFIIIALYYFNEGTINSISDLLRIISISKGYNNWGVIWLVIALVIVINVSFIKQKNFAFWINILVIFFLMRIILYSLGFFPHPTSQTHSGSRILLHIMPIGVFYIFFLLSSILSDKSIYEIKKT